MKIASCVAIVALTCTMACAHKSKATAALKPPPGASGAGAGAANANAASNTPLTPDDLQARMRIIGPAVGRLRANLASSHLPDAANDAQTLSTAFGDVARFWQQHNRTDAAMWAQQAQSGANDVLTAAKAGDAAKANAAAGALQSVCTQCHNAYRQGDPQRGFQIRPGSV